MQPIETCLKTRMTDITTEPPFQLTPYIACPSPGNYRLNRLACLTPGSADIITLVYYSD